MREYLKSFWTWVGSLAAFFGLYLGAVAVNLTWVFWAVMSLAALIAVAPQARKTLAHYVQRIRDYPSLMEQKKDLEAQLDLFTSQLAEATNLAKLQYEAGLTEGRARIFGTVHSWDGAPPRIVGIKVQDGEICLVGRFDSESRPRSGARYAVIYPETQEILGAVELCGQIHKAGAIMKCVERTSAEFWAHLEQRAGYDQLPPSGVEVVPYVHDGLSIVLIGDSVAETVEAPKDGK